MIEEVSAGAVKTPSGSSFLQFWKINFWLRSSKLLSACPAERYCRKKIWNEVKTFQNSLHNFARPVLSQLHSTRPWVFLGGKNKQKQEIMSFLGIKVRKLPVEIVKSGFEVFGRKVGVRIIFLLNKTNSSFYSDFQWNSSGCSCQNCPLRVCGKIYDDKVLSWKIISVSFCGLSA